MKGRFAKKYMEPTTFVISVAILNSKRRQFQRREKPLPHQNSANGVSSASLSYTCQIQKSPEAAIRNPNLVMHNTIKRDTERFAL
ncbi:hypothetical protein E2542_SST13887 [Spatholobus suberectus]|nr:hypothetical protein E2542_SST13887 [Spatholobus suberectus]